MVFKISLCILTLIVLASSDDYSGLFSRLYKKASNEKRPLILVLDNSYKGENVAHADQAPRDENVDIDSDVPLNLIELLNQKRHSVKHEHQHQSIISILADNNDAEPSSNNGDLEASFVQSDLQRLRDRLEKERERRRESKKSKERRERLNRVQYNNDDEGQDRNNNNQQDKEEDRNQNRDKGAQQNRNQNRQQNRNQHRHQDRNKQRQQERYRIRNRERHQRNQDRNMQKQQDRNQDREVQRQQATNQDSNPFLEKNKALRSSVIKNLLRTYNNLNCEAKDECQDECNKYNGKKQNQCEDKCEVKYECEESEPEDDCKKDECDDSDEFGSTKGVRLVTVTEKCKRC